MSGRPESEGENEDVPLCLHSLVWIEMKTVYALDQTKPGYTF